MPPLSLLLLHEIFPSFPPLPVFLAAGLVVGAAISAIASWHRQRQLEATRIGGEILGAP